MIPNEEQGLVSPSDIADLAGVSRAAVSNWRKRADDFPQPVAGSASKPLFSRKEVTVWLEGRGHQPKRDAGETHVWAAMNLLREQLSVEEATELLLSLLVSRKTATTVEREWRAIDKATRLRVQEAIDQVDDDKLGSVADFALERLARSQVRVGGAEHGFVGSRTSKMLASLAASRPCDVLYDPACGIATALLEAVDLGARPEKVVGHDINQQVLHIAAQRAELEGVRVELVRTNVLIEDVDPALRADVIILEPPFGLRFDAQSRLMDARFEFGTPPLFSADTAWLQHVVAHLSESGRGYALTALGTLFRGGKECKIRAELLRRGCVEAIVGLPGKLLPHTPIPLGLWVLRRPVPTSVTGQILFIDASETDAPENHVAAWLSDPVARQAVPHVEVPVADVLAAESVLTPQHWVGKTESEPGEVAAAYAAGWAAINNTVKQMQSIVSYFEHVTTFPKPRVMTVGELIEQGVLDLRIGRPKERYQDAPLELRDRIATAADVRDGTLHKTSLNGEYDQYDELTQKGDVLATTMNTIRSVVDEVGGHLPTTGIHRLRILDQNVLSPDYLAIALTGSWNERFQTGSTIQRASIRDLEVPLVPKVDQHKIQHAMKSIELFHQAAARLADHAVAVSTALLDAVRYEAPLATPAAGFVGPVQQDGYDAKGVL